MVRLLCYTSYYWVENIFLIRFLTCAIESKLPLKVDTVWSHLIWKAFFVTVIGLGGFADLYFWLLSPVSLIHNNICLGEIVGLWPFLSVFPFQES